MYSTRSGLVLGFHGCDESVVQDVLNGKTILKQSNNDAMIGWDMEYIFGKIVLLVLWSLQNIYENFPANLEEQLENRQ